MKQSFYNFILHKNDKAYWFNALSFRHFILPNDLSSKIEPLLESDSTIHDIHESFRNKLFDNGFVIDDDCNEIDIIRNRNEKAIHSKDYMLVVLPTLNCNFKCWYCIQNHIPSMMDDDIFERIKQHIKHMVHNEEISSLSLEWFGGEPFMYFNKIVKPITQYAKDICEEAKIPFEASATTNSYFITSEISKQLQSLRFTHFQISLDGNKKFHDKVKFQNGCESTFERALTNINGILDNNPYARVFLRFNYNHENLTPDVVEEINPFISKENRKRVIVVTRKVWQADVDKSYSIQLQEILDGFSKSGYITTRWSPISNYIPCYANKKYYNAINYNGNAVKCTACNDLYEEEPKGVLQKDGTILWNNEFDKRYQCKSFENEVCLNCKELPICMGNCPRDFINGHCQCKKESVDETIENALIDYIENFEKDITNNRI